MNHGYHPASYRPERLDYTAHERVKGFSTGVLMDQGAEYKVEKLSVDL